MQTATTIPVQYKKCQSNFVFVEKIRWRMATILKINNLQYLHNHSAYRYEMCKVRSSDERFQSRDQNSSQQ